MALAGNDDRLPGRPPVAEGAGDARRSGDEPRDGAFHVDLDAERDRPILQGPDHLEARPVAHVCQPRVRMAAEWPLQDPAVRGPIEHRAPQLELADGRAPRDGGAGTGPRARAVGRRLRSDRGRPDPAAAVRWPFAPAARPRRRPDRPRDDPHPPGPRRRARHPGLHGVHDHPPDHRPAAVTGAFGYWRTTGEPIVFPAKSVVLATGGIGKALRGHLELLGVQRRRPGARLRGRRRADRHGVRPVPPDRDGLAARRARPARHRGGPRRGRDPAQQGRRAVHVGLPARGPAGGVRRDRRGGGAAG